MLGSRTAGQQGTGAWARHREQCRAHTCFLVGGWQFRSSEQEQCLAGRGSSSQCGCVQAPYIRSGRAAQPTAIKQWLIVAKNGSACDTYISLLRNWLLPQVPWQAAG
jgi:hypothetical protein